MKKLTWPLAVAAILFTALCVACGGVEKENDSTDECVNIVMEVKIPQGVTYSCEDDIQPLRYGEGFGLCVSCGNVFSLGFNGPGKIIFSKMHSEEPFQLRFKYPNGYVETSSEVQLTSLGTVTATVVSQHH